MFQYSTLTFLQNLKDNNHKEWFDDNKENYTKARLDFEQFVQVILDNLSVANPDLANLTAKSCTFRINRDLRFSKNKTPYKINMAASIKKGGRKSVFAGYYFHLEPGNKSFYGGGLWMPESSALKKIRQEIDYCFEEFKHIIHATLFKNTFGELERDGQALIHAPRGYENNHPAADYLKLKSFFVNKNLEDKDLTRPDLSQKVIEDFRLLLPLLRFLNRSLE